MSKQKSLPFKQHEVQAVLNDTQRAFIRYAKGSENGCLFNGGPHPCPNEPMLFYPGEVGKGENGDPDVTVDFVDVVTAHFFCSTMDRMVKCPYGKPGDILAVKESFIHAHPRTGKKYLYQADGVELGAVDMWESSVTMPLEAVRIYLEVEAITVKRIQDVTEEEADALLFGGDYPHRIVPEIFSEHKHGGYSNAECYGIFFQSIYGKEAFDRNEWQWLVSFKVLSTTGKPAI
jgi:hypothetical protein